MSDDYTLLVLSISILIVGGFVLALMPLLTFTSFNDSIPTERWCNKFNESFYLENHRIDNERYFNEFAAYHHYCFKNDSGWHLNASVPLVLI